MQDISTKFEKQDSGVNYNDDLSEKQIQHLESILNRMCKKCDSIKAPQSHHCSTCMCCIARMDHHCPWVNNCVGFYNQKHFLLFLVYVFLGSTYALVLIAKQCYNCFNDNCWMFLEGGTLVIAGLSLYLGLLFAIFEVVMFYDQISCIVDNTSTIDKLQKKRAIKDGKKVEEVETIESRTWQQNICEVMTGSIHEGVSWKWFVPTDIEPTLFIENEY